MAKSHTRLNTQDQEKVRKFLSSGVNASERSPFKPVKLIIWLLIVILGLGVLSRLIGYLILGN